MRTDTELIIDYMEEVRKLHKRIARLENALLQIEGYYADDWTESDDPEHPRNIAHKALENEQANLD